MIDPITHLDRTTDAQNKLRYRLITVAIVLSIAGFGCVAWWVVHRGTTTQNVGVLSGPGGSVGNRSGGIATSVAVATAELARMPVTLEALGTVTPTATVTVVPQVSGTISRVLFHEGQLAKAGQVLATIDPKLFQIARMQAEGNLQRDQANLVSARLTLGRYETLMKQDSIAGQDFDTQAATVKQLEGTVLADQSAVDTAKLNLNYTNITAPVSGRLGLRVVDVGNYVSAGVATGVAVITVVDPIDVEFSIPQDLIPLIMKRVTNDKVTLPATVLDRSRVNALAQGRFLTLDNRVDTTTGTVKAKAQFSNKEGILFPNQFVNVRILIDTLQNVVLVPTSAVRQGSTGSFVYVLDPSSSTVTMRDVKTGQSDGDNVVISDGLKSGEIVITEGADRLKNGSKVKAPESQSITATKNANGKPHGEKKKNSSKQQ